MPSWRLDNWKKVQYKSTDVAYDNMKQLVSSSSTIKMTSVGTELDVEEIRQHWLHTTLHYTMLHDGILQHICGHSWSCEQRSLDNGGDCLSPSTHTFGTRCWKLGHTNMSTYVTDSSTHACAHFPNSFGTLLCNQQHTCRCFLVVMRPFLENKIHLRANIMCRNNIVLKIYSNQKYWLQGLSVSGMMKTSNAFPVAYQLSSCFDNFQYYRLPPVSLHVFK